MKRIFLIIFILILVGIFIYFLRGNSNVVADNQLSSLSITAMRDKSYPGSNIIIEQKLPSGSNYHSYLVSYQSEGVKNYGLLTVPTGQKPKDGWPVILFNHGYIPPDQYSTENSYLVMVIPLAQAGYIVFKPD